MKRKTFICIALILVGIATSCQSKKSENPVNTKVSTEQSITIATIDTDSIFAKYDMVIDVTKELEAVEKKLTGDLQARASRLQADVQNYSQIATTLTYSEQQKKEQQFHARQESLARLEQQYTQQLLETRTKKNMEVQDKIFTFIETYNKEHGNYTLILSKARTSGVLYSPQSMDITQGVLEALNADYIKNRNKK